MAVSVTGERAKSVWTLEMLLKPFSLCFSCVVHTSCCRKKIYSGSNLQQNLTILMGSVYCMEGVMRLSQICVANLVLNHH